MSGAGALAGRRILVAEDEYFIATELVEALRGAGAVVIGPASTPAEAAGLASRDADPPDAALLDVNLGGQAIWPVLDLLAARGVPVLLATGYDIGAVPRAHAHLPRQEKPVSTRALLQALAECIAAGPVPSRTP